MVVELGRAKAQVRRNQGFRFGHRSLRNLLPIQGEVSGGQLDVACGVEV